MFFIWIDACFGYVLWMVASGVAMCRAEKLNDAHTGAAFAHLVMWGNMSFKMNHTKEDNLDPLAKETFLFLISLMKECLNGTETQHSSILNDTYDPYGPACPHVFDGYACWDETPAGTTAYQKCPSFVVGFDPQRYAYKRCMENGTWYSAQPYSNTSWTNYTACVDLEDLSFRSIVNDIYVYGYSVSTVALLISITMFIYFRALQCTRIRIHMHLFTACVINNILWIIWYRAVVNQPEVVQNNEHWCQILHVMTHYFMVTCYLWMFLEALHLNIALVVVFVNDQLAMRCFIIAGWGVSFIITAAYSLVRYFVYGDIERCWIEQSNSFWVIAVPVVASIFASFIFLINVVCILLTKLYPTPNEDNTLALKKATRAAFLLIPLFGLHFTLIPLRPSPTSTFEKVYQVFSALLTSLQGLCVAILFCFTNHDMKAATRHHFARALRTNDGIAMTALTRGESLVNTRDNIA